MGEEPNHKSAEKAMVLIISESYQNCQNEVVNHQLVDGWGGGGGLCWEDSEPVHVCQRGALYSVHATVSFKRGNSELTRFVTTVWQLLYPFYLTARVL